nr:MAG TPA: hypothetical protein [Caudoviricetes sp.]
MNSTFRVVLVKKSGFEVISFDDCISVTAIPIVAADGKAWQIKLASDTGSTAIRSYAMSQYCIAIM